jgi:hypothetical protein
MWICTKLGRRSKLGEVGLLRGRRGISGSGEGGIEAM